jgi:hypothetical protein
MKTTRNRFRQVSVLTLLIATLLSGVFAAGFRDGFLQGKKEVPCFADFESLMALIESTVVPDSWEALGGATTMAPYPSNIPSGCYAEVVDHLADAGVIHCIPIWNDANGDLATADATIDEPSP